MAISNSTMANEPRYTSRQQVAELIALSFAHNGRTWELDPDEQVYFSAQPCPVLRVLLHDDEIDNGKITGKFRSAAKPVAIAKNTPLFAKRVVDEIFFDFAQRISGHHENWSNGRLTDTAWAKFVNWSRNYGVTLEDRTAYEQSPTEVIRPIHSKKEKKTTESAANGRYHFLDAARAVMLLLGVPMHIGEVYRVSGGWAIASDTTSYVATFVTMLIHSFRMPAFFIMSGFFSLMILQRAGNAPWIKGRVLKLGIPLLLASLLLAPVEETIVNIFSAHMSIKDAVLASFNMPLMTWINHRWFLLTLLSYCLTLSAFTLLKLDIDKTFKSASKIFDILGPFKHVALWVLLAIISFGSIFIGQIVGDRIFHSPDLKQIVIYFSKFFFFFFLGFFLFSTGKIEDFTKINLGSSVITIVLISIYGVTYFGFYPTDFLDAYPVAKYGSIGIELLTGYYVAKMFFSAMKSIVHNESIAVKYFVESSYSIYLIHMALVYLFCGILLGDHGAPLVKFFVASGMVLMLSLVAFEIIRRSKILSWIFNGGPVKHINFNVPSS